MELRLYSFVTYYLSSIQQGIQTGHAAVDLVRKYTANGNPLRRDISHHNVELVNDWADNWKTFIVLNGGNAEGIRKAKAVIAAQREFPWVSFREDDESLDGIQTCVAVVLPECIFNAKLEFDANGAACYVYRELSPENGALPYEAQYYESNPHYQLINLIKSSRLAS